MSVLRLILGDQLSYNISSLEDVNRNTDIILICEVIEEATYVKHHKKKIAFLFSAMRHFAEELKEKGYKVRYIKLDDPNNSGSFEGEIKRALQELNLDKIIVTEPGEYRVLEKFRSLQKEYNLEIRQDNRFLCSINEFKNWAKGKKQLRMEYFYREMRKKYNILIDSKNNPVGGKWNYDRENRKPPASNLFSPNRISHKKNAITKDVLKLVENRFSNHFGDLEPFHYAVTREQALIEARHFIDNILQYFGDYQDAMLKGEAYLYHSLLSSYLNAGLLLPLELCKLAEDSYKNGLVSLNACEGYIRQILGWREFIRGIYWVHMPEYADINFLGSSNNLPEFYWTAETDMLCMKEAITHTKMHSYSHHIQRLMVTGNFALLAMISPKEICDWYLAVYSDAYEWVELPNTLGMALFGDGGIVGSKPYAASGKYINKMSNFCKSCKYDVEKAVGEKACPFNSLYWHFINKHQDMLRKNQRMSYIYSTLDKMSPENKEKIFSQACSILQKIKENSKI